MDYPRAGFYAALSEQFAVRVLASAYQIGRRRTWPRWPPIWIPPGLTIQYGLTSWRLVIAPLSMTSRYRKAGPPVESHV